MHSSHFMPLEMVKKKKLLKLYCPYSAMARQSFAIHLLAVSYLGIYSRLNSLGHYTLPIESKETHYLNNGLVWGYLDVSFLGRM